MDKNCKSRKKSFQNWVYLKIGGLLIPVIFFLGSLPVTGKVNIDLQNDVVSLELAVNIRLNENPTSSTPSSLVNDEGNPEDVN